MTRIALDLYDDRMKFVTHFDSKREAAAVLRMSVSTITQWAMDKQPRDGMYLVISDPVARAKAEQAARATGAPPNRTFVNAKVQRNAARSVLAALGTKM